MIFHVMTAFSIIENWQKIFSPYFTLKRAPLCVTFNREPITNKKLKKKRFLWYHGSNLGIRYNQQTK